MIYQSNKVWYSPQKGLAKSFRKDCSKSQRICFKPWKDLANPSFSWSKHEATLNSALGAVSISDFKREFYFFNIFFPPYPSHFISWLYMFFDRHLLQLHHVHGGLQRRHHHHGPQLPPQAGRHAWDAGVGEHIVEDLLFAEQVEYAETTKPLPGVGDQGKIHGWMLCNL